MDYAIWNSIVFIKSLGRSICDAVCIQERNITFP